MSAARGLALLVAALAAGPRAARAEDTAAAEAQAHAAHAQVFVGRLAFRDAIADYRRAVQAAPRPDWFYNLGWLYFRLGEQADSTLMLDDKREAVAWFGRYVEAVPAAADRESVRAWIGTLEREIPALEVAARTRAEAARSEAAARDKERKEFDARLKAAEARAERAEKREREQRFRLRLGGGVAAAGVLVGAVGGVLVSKAYTDAIIAGRGPLTGGAIDFNLFGSAFLTNTAGSVLLGAGLIAGVAGILVMTLPGPRSSPPVSLRLTQQGISLIGLW